MVTSSSNSRPFMIAEHHGRSGAAPEPQLEQLATFINFVYLVSVMAARLSQLVIYAYAYARCLEVLALRPSLMPGQATKG